jgi:hypothetical protein
VHNLRDHVTSRFVLLLSTRTRMTGPQKIHANAQLVTEKFRLSSGLGPRFGFNRKSVECVEQFIENECRARITSSKLAKLVSVLGSYLGEAVIHEYGGSWR